MLSQPVYALYVTHVNGEWRRLEPAECPLMVQLDWVKESGETDHLELLLINKKYLDPRSTLVVFIASEGSTES